VESCRPNALFATVVDLEPRKFASPDAAGPPLTEDPAADDCLSYRL
jgi:hypothetical protein